MLRNREVLNDISRSLYNGHMPHVATLDQNTSADVQVLCDFIREHISQRNFMLPPMDYTYASMTHRLVVWDAVVSVTDLEFRANTEMCMMYNHAYRWLDTQQSTITPRVPLVHSLTPEYEAVRSCMLSTINVGAGFTDHSGYHAAAAACGIVGYWDSLKYSAYIRFRLYQMLSPFIDNTPRIP